MEMTIDIGNRKPEDKWQPNETTKGKFLVLVLPLQAETIKGVSKDKDKDGTVIERPWEYTQLCNITDGRKSFAGGKVYGVDDTGKRVALKIIGKLMPAESDRKSGASVTVCELA